MAAIGGQWSVEGGLVLLWEVRCCVGQKPSLAASKGYLLVLMGPGCRCLSECMNPELPTHDALHSSLRSRLGVPWPA